MIKDIKKSDKVYGPSEDTYLLLKALDSFLDFGMKGLDMGTGTGIIARKMAEKADCVTAVDISNKSVKLAKENTSDLENVKVLQSDLFQKIEKETFFDIITFNPPYLPINPDESIKDEISIAWEGGKDGLYIIKRFLKDVCKYLSEEGIVLMISSSLISLDKIEKLANGKDMSCEIFLKEKIFFEELYALKLTPNV